MFSIPSLNRSLFLLGIGVCFTSIASAQSTPPPSPQNSAPTPVQVQQRSNRIPNPVKNPVQNQVQIQIPNQMQNRNSNPAFKAQSPKDLKKAIERLPLVPLKTYDRPQIQIALVLDISGSMNGLLNQTREELWKVINLFNGVQYKGETPEIRVALYTQGMRKAKTDLFLDQRLALTTDLDQVSEILFSLKIEGSQEYSPSSLYTASRGLAWSSAPSDFKSIIIAGNEGFVQGPISMDEGFIPVKERNLITHTIHCGDQETGIRDLWKQAAKNGGGQFLNINQNAKVEYIETPYDDPIQKLNTELNETYIPYGTMGKKGYANQRVQDSNAMKMSKSSAIQRSITKSNSYYSNDQWDLVDAVRNQKVELSKLNFKLLPSHLQKLDSQSLLAYVQKKQNQRNQIQDQISKLKKERSSYLKKERAKRQEKGQKRLDSVLIEALRKQALSLGFTWTKESE